jgi:hypothetical protein
MSNEFYAQGDPNSDTKGSGARANGGKVSFSLIPFHLLAGAARVFMGGKLKYAEWNWTKGMKWSTVMDCIFRHLFKYWFCREDIDPESGEHHLHHVVCNVLMLIHYDKAYKEGDDRPGPNTCLSRHLDEVNLMFDEAAYLERNPAIKAIVEARREAAE